MSADFGVIDATRTRNRRYHKPELYRLSYDHQCQQL